MPQEDPFMPQEESTGEPGRIAAHRRLTTKITFLLVVSFVLIVVLFLSVLLPYQRAQSSRFIADRLTFLDVLMQARRGEIVNLWAQQSARAHWHQFQKTILRHPNIRHATLYLRDKATAGGSAPDAPGSETLAVTSDPALVAQTLRAAEASGLVFRHESAAEGRAGAPFLVAVGGRLWIRAEDGRGLSAAMGSFRTRPASDRLMAVGVEALLEQRSGAGERRLEYAALIYIGDPARPSFGKVGHLVIQYGLADLDIQESSVRTLFYSLLAVLFLVLLGLLNLSLGRSVVRPIREVLGAMRRAGGGDLEVRVAARSRDEIGMMAESFNRMVQDLERSKEAIEEYNRTLEQRVADRTAKLVQSERQARGLRDHLSAVLRHVRAGVIALDTGGKIVTFNERSGELLGLDPSRVLDRSAREALGAPSLEPLCRLLSEAPPDPVGVANEIKLGPPGKLRTFRVARTALEGGGTVLVIDDVTDLIYSKRLLAWREAVERVIHDIKNPLTPVRLSAEQIRVAYEDDSPDFERIVDKGTRNILSSVTNLEAMLAEFSLLYRRPRADTRPVDLNALVTRVMDEHAPALTEGITPVLRLADGLPEVVGDPLSLWRLVTNVIQNGMEAMRGRTGRFTVQTERAEGAVRLSVIDEGGGIPPDRLDKLFEPYFTTKAKGTGLGLVIARQIVEDHGGTIEIRSEVGKGTTAVIDLPLRV